MFTIGQTLWIYFTETWRQNPELKPYVVTKIGHKWLTVSQEGYPLITERVAISDMHLDGGQYNSPGRAYLSKEVYVVEQVLNATWDKLHKYVRDNYRVPDNVSLAQITAAIEALKIP